AEEPDDHAAGERFDHAVDPEPDQRDRPRRDPRADRDRELDCVPSVAAPGEQLRAPLERGPLLRSQTRRPAPKLDGGTHADTLRRVAIVSRRVMPGVVILAV